MHQITLLHAPSPDPWPAPVPGNELLSDLAAVVSRFVVLPKWAAETLALWCLHTFAFQLRDVSAYLGIESPEKRCGKTTLLSVLSELVNRPVIAANISPPALFRVIEETNPTLLIDEADTLLYGNDELRGILNSGYTRKTAYVVRVASRPKAPKPASPSPVPQHHPPLPTQLTHLTQSTHLTSHVLARFSCWCPKVMAAIGRLPETLADRCIVIPMQRKTFNEQCERLRNLDGLDLRRRCARFVADNAAAIASARPDIPDCLNDRAADIWEPLFALADLSGGSWPQTARQAAIALSTRAQETSPSVSLLLDLLELFATTKGDRIFSRDIVAGLNERTDRPWAQTRAGKGVTELWLAQQLRAYGVRPKTMKIGEDFAKGYLRDRMMEIFRRYIPRTDVAEMLAEYRRNEDDAPEREPGL